MELDVGQTKEKKLEIDTKATIVALLKVNRGCGIIGGLLARVGVGKSLPSLNGIWFLRLFWGCVVWLT
jgi:hypothetical protein